MNTFPGTGGVETETVNLMEMFSGIHDIYVLAFGRCTDSRLPEQVREAYYFRGKDLEENRAFYNGIVAGRRITHVINQGMYYFLNEIIFNPQRDLNVRIVSELHGMPGYEKQEYWKRYPAKSLRTAGRRLLSRFGLNRSYCRYLRLFYDSYRMAVSESYRTILLCREYIGEFCRMYDIPPGLRSGLVAVPNHLPASLTGCGEPDFDSKENIILFVGRLSEEKNVGLDLKAWKRLYPHLENWKFVIVGDGALRKDLESQAQGLPRVEFVGSVRNPAPYYAKAKILVLSSGFEGFPMALIEAQRSGTVPVAYPCSSGVAAIIRDGGGVSVPKLTAGSLAACIYKLASDEARLRELALSSYRRSESFRADLVAGQWNELLNE